MLNVYTVKLYPCGMRFKQHRGNDTVVVSTRWKLVLYVSFYVYVSEVKVLFPMQIMTLY